MLHRVNHRFYVYDGPAPEATLQLERDGYALVKGLLNAAEVAEIKADIVDVFERVGPDFRAGSGTPEHAEMFRYQMFNRSAKCQELIGRPEILSIVEPLVGDDCHILSCTAWRNPPEPSPTPDGQEWHSDGGPHVPRSPDVEWPDNIPYPVFAVATHIFLEDCGVHDGPTAVLPGTHKSGMPPPVDKRWELKLKYKGRKSFPCLAEAGDMALFVSDVWHRRMPPRRKSRGRFFLQTNYSRRDIAQRVQPTELINHANDESRARAKTHRERQLLGLHPESFYDG